MTDAQPPAAADPDGRRPIRRALVSVSDKTGLAELARGLAAAGVEIVSTGSTARVIAEAGAAVTPVERLTGFPESLDGRVKTLHPAVHAGVLADVRRADHLAQLADLGIEPFELVVVNLYPFAATVASGAAPDEVVEQIDVGGPALVRAAAKNHASVAVVVEPGGYADVLAALGAGGFTAAARRRLAARAFAHTASYDVAVASWLHARAAPTEDGPLPPWLGGTWERVAPLRYGENPHQAAALYRPVSGRPGLADARLLHGKEMSHNNYLDTDAAVRAAYDHDGPAVVIVKHANPCGVAVGSSDAADPLAQAHARALDCDPVSAFGGVVAANRPVTAAMAAQVAEVFTEVVAAPGFDPGALDLLSARRTVRLLQLPDPPPRPAVELRAVAGAALLQVADRFQAPGDAPDAWNLATGDPADPETLADLVFAWRAVRAVKSNAILLARGGAAVGIGMGQVNRVDSCRLAVERAGAERARGAVAASDAFFPFPDGLRVLVDAGVRAVVQPGGSVRDGEVVAAAASAGATMYLTGARHFAH
ncbi:MAG: bifunctional phosphoribosylaminoimidazolecarboxamide formyltransferase/IMP cyclohydrolase [Kineosporiaceae bacterium]